MAKTQRKSVCRAPPGVVPAAGMRGSTREGGGVSFYDEIGGHDTFVALVRHF
jgi:hypothetical protein